MFLGCQPCCAQCPDYGVFLSASRVFATIEHSYQDEYLLSEPPGNLIASESDQESFTKTYELPLSSGGGAQLFAGFSTIEIVNNQPKLEIQLSVLRTNFQTSNLSLLVFPRLNKPFGASNFIGVREQACSADSQFARAGGFWQHSANFPYFSQRNVGLFEVVYARDGEQSVFRGESLRPFQDLALNQRQNIEGVLRNSCFDGDLVGIGRINDSVAHPQSMHVRFTSLLETDSRVEYQFYDQKLTLLSLEADFGSFHQNMLMDVSPAYWSNTEPDNFVRWTGDGGTAGTLVFDTQETICSALTHN